MLELQTSLPWSHRCRQRNPESEMTMTTEADALVIRDADGMYYVLTAEVLAQARATTEQRTALVFNCRTERVAGQIANDLREREPYQVFGVAPMPLPQIRRENPFWPGVFE
jgi:hypothetical protein